MNLVKQIREIEENKRKEISDFKSFEAEINKAIRLFAPYCMSVQIQQGYVPQYIKEKNIECDYTYFRGSLYIQKVDSIPVIKAMEGIIAVYKDRLEKHEKSVKEYDSLLATLNEQNDACTRCNGTGKIHYRPNSYCEVEEVMCPDCLGTGVPIRKNKK